ncbi:MAG TPA: DinB family protein [Dongiaceae bacterium]|jgi:transcriptional regulator with XRE-family HTH domain|nr:DinB family protein [Dongiaceae bacterium]
MLEPNVTILRDAQGEAQHAILPWDQFQELMQAAKAGEPAAQIGELQLPPQVSRGIAEGAHPVRAWREYRSLNQGQLAAVVGISRAYLTQIEGGERTGTLEVTARIARALGCRIEQLIAPAEDFAGRIAALAAMPSKLKDIVAMIPRDAWTRRPGNGGFSLVEHVCHLRDIDEDGYRERVARILTEVQPSLPDIDGDALARERDYQSQDLEAALSAFAAARWQISARLAKLTPEERRRTGLMAAIREITIEGVVGAMLAHDSEHLDQLSELRGVLAG